jgi:hypothetical protein
MDVGRVSGVSFSLSVFYSVGINRAHIREVPASILGREPAIPCLCGHDQFFHANSGGVPRLEH